MNTDYILKLLEKLCLADGTSGDEGTAAKIAAEELEKYMSVTRDKLGNVIGRQEGEGTHFLLDAHIDRIGLVVTAITDEGFVKVGACGGVDTRTLDAAEVVIYGRKPIYGVVSAIPPHLTKSGENKASDVSDIAIDIGMDKETAEEILINAGLIPEFNEVYNPEFAKGKVTYCFPEVGEQIDDNNKRIQVFVSVGE